MKAEMCLVIKASDLEEALRLQDTFSGYNKVLIDVSW